MDEQIQQAFDLTGRVAVVTGAGGGIGRQAALTFAGAGAAVVVADVLGDRLDETAAALEAKGAKMTVVPTDMSAFSDLALKTRGLQHVGFVDGSELAPSRLGKARRNTGHPLYFHDRI